MSDANSQSAIGPGDIKSLARRADFALGDATVRPSRRKLEGPLSSATAEPRVMQVLIALADARGKVLSREDLLHLCWDGRIVGDDAVNRAIAEVRRIATVVGARFEIETVPRVGYRLSGIDWDQPMIADLATDGRVVERRKLLAGGAAGLALLTGGGALFLNQRRGADVEELLARGKALQASGGQAGDKQAEALFRQAIALDPKRADAWGWLAAVLDEYDPARDAAQRALDLDPKEPNARVVMAYQRRDLDSWTQWEDALLAVLDDAPDNTAALNRLTFFFQGMGRCRDSWNTNERLLGVEPFNRTGQHRRAIKHWIFGRVGEADKVADRGMQLWPRDAFTWNARILIYACTDRPQAALALLDDAASRPENLTRASERSWRAALEAIATRSRSDIARALQTFTAVAPLAPGLAANAIMISSHLGEIDAAFGFAEGLFDNRGALVQRTRGSGIRDVYSGSSWGRTQFLFIPATTAFRADSRFPDLCRRLGHIVYWQKRGIWPDPFVRGAIEPEKYR